MTTHICSPLDTKLLLTVKETAELLSISAREVYNASADGRLARRYIGSGRRSFRIPAASVRDYVDTLSRYPTP